MNEMIINEIAKDLNITTKQVSVVLDLLILDTVISK